MIVREIMTKDVVWTAPTTMLADAARRMRDRNIGCLPVGNYGDFIGILTEKDFTVRATAEGLDPTVTMVLDIMTRGVIFCSEDENVEDALATMRERHIHHLPVRSSLNRIVGIVSLSDLALKAPRELWSDVAKLVFQNAALNRASASWQH